jgi:protein SCO1
MAAPMPSIEGFTRRGFLQSSMALAVGERDHGLINPPLAVPDIALVRHDGVATSLPKLAAGHATGLQLMFTECMTTCPMQGAIFEKVQKLLPDMAARGIQLASLSIDPKNDNPAALSAWLQRFHAGAVWIGAAPDSQDLEQLKTFFGRGRGASDDHSTQVHILNREGRLVWRTFELPSPEEIAALLRRI